MKLVERKSSREETIRGLFKVEIGKLRGGGQSDEMRKAVEEEIRLQLCLGGECGGGYIGLINFFW
jgi:hypothetical protein